MGEDLVAAALVELAAAVRAEHCEDAGPGPQLEAERLLVELGLADTRWRDLFRTAVAQAAGSLDGIPG